MIIIIYLKVGKIDILRPLYYLPRRSEVSCNPKRIRGRPKIVCGSSNSSGGGQSNHKKKKRIPLLLKFSFIAYKILYTELLHK